MKTPNIINQRLENYILFWGSHVSNTTDSLGNTTKTERSLKDSRLRNKTEGERALHFVQWVMLGHMKGLCLLQDTPKESSICQATD